MLHSPLPGFLFCLLASAASQHQDSTRLHQDTTRLHQDTTRLHQDTTRLNELWSGFKFPETREVERQGRAVEGGTEGGVGRRSDAPQQPLQQVLKW